MSKAPPHEQSASGAPTLPNAARSAPPAESAQRTLQRTVRGDQICVLTFDRPGSTANIFDKLTLTELGEELDLIAAAPQLKGLVITSAKPSIFIAGADLKSMTQDASPVDVGALIELGQNVFNRLAALPIPTVAAIHGAALGGGYEICLACDYRVASDHRATKIGLPETQLGLIPAWGGCTRLPRLIGLPKALDIILAGKSLASKPALKRGMVDDLVPAEYLVETALRMLCRGKPNRPIHRLTNNPLVAAAIAVRLRSQLLKRTRAHYPAVVKALAVVTRGVSKSIPDSLALEREAIAQLVQTEACRNLIRVFFLQERAKKLKLTPVREQPSHPGPLPLGGGERETTARVAVIGAGIMGAGIAQWLSARQLPVILRDINAEQVAKGLASIAKLYQDGLKRHVFTPREVRNGLDRISPATSDVPLRHVDLVIEAATENLDLKKKIFQRLDELAGDETVLATNTSALPISELAAATRRPERVLGLHFFNPVHRMQLVEIIAARQTAPQALQRALRFVQQIGKLPVIVKDSPGFLVNRILMPYLLEAASLFTAGASISDLDEAMLDFGMPMGPMRLLDEVGIDVALHVARTVAAPDKARMSAAESLGKMLQAGLLGRKTARGFYLYPAKRDKDPRPNPRASQYQLPTQDRRSSVKDRKLRITNYQSRMVFLMLNEAARCLEEQIVSEPADVDFAMIMGTGFAPFRGGPLRYADSLGAAKVVGVMEHLADAGAAQFKPCELLAGMAQRGERFYKD